MEALVGCGESQRLRALARANAVRLARAELKRRILAGEVRVIEVLTECPSEVSRWPVIDLLTSQRGWGAARARRLLSRSGISENRQLGQLTERQRGLLVRELERRDARELSPTG